MRWGTIILAACLVAAPAYAEVKRDDYRPWEKDIGYARAVRHGDTLYISGVTAQGATVAEQMSNIYAEIGDILKAHGLDSKAVVIETIYTRDIEAVKAAIAIRKQFYVDDVYPAATWVQIERLFDEKQLIEIEIEAAL
ncbi:Rid family hydrolase [Asticcacaulis biprosthecium]|uniref:Rid family hydrolase n=1 Tax=Asticcacaulis biprosthecium TaxID=76891 RepID=UPI0002F4BA44|nr:Rid family hydrolase [Asticcacaulis biprosthecium]